MNIEQNKIISLLAAILEGTQVPRSFGAGYLGAATAPWDELRGELRLFGYPDLEEHKEKLIKALGLNNALEENDGKRSSARSQ